MGGSTNRHGTRIVVMAGLVALAALLGGRTVMAKDIEEPKYRLERDYGSFEVRAYEPYVVARTWVAGSFNQTLNQGFRRLAGFIFGGNTQGTSIAMTAPVAAIPAEGGWVVTFSMPSAWSYDRLPKPNDARVELTKVPARRMAVIRFSGWVGYDKMKDKETRLRALMREHNLEPQGEPVLAQYNPPWTLPFWRRNELMLAIGN